MPAPPSWDEALLRAAPPLRVGAPFVRAPPPWIGAPLCSAPRHRRPGLGAPSHLRPGLGPSLHRTSTLSWGSLTGTYTLRWGPLPSLSTLWRSILGWRGHLQPSLPGLCPRLAFRISKARSFWEVLHKLRWPLAKVIPECSHTAHPSQRGCFTHRLQPASLA